MDMVELHQHQCWKDGVVLEEQDWEKCRKTVPTDKAGKNRVMERVSDLNKAYRTNVIEPENVAWFNQTKTDMIPLVKAIGKVRKARKDASGGRTDVDPLEFSENKALKKLAQTTAAFRSMMPSKVRETMKRADLVEMFFC